MGASAGAADCPIAVHAACSLHAVWDCYLRRRHTQRCGSIPFSPRISPSLTPQCGQARFPNNPALLIALANIQVTVSMPVGFQLPAQRRPGAARHKMLVTSASGLPAWMPFGPQVRKDGQASRTQLQLAIKAQPSLVQRYFIFAVRAGKRGLRLAAHAVPGTGACRA